MARVTIEDCLDNVDNRFQLVLVATKRARQILLGGQATVEESNDKPTVTALREIAAGHVTRDILNQPDYGSVDEWALEEGEESLEAAEEGSEEAAAVAENTEDAVSEVTQES